MSQISPPIRILLIAAVGLMAAYMLFLRPKDEAAVPAAPAPAVVPAKDPNAQTSSKPGAAVQQAVNGANTASARADAAAGGAVADAEGGTAQATGTTPATQAPTTAAGAEPAPITKEALARLPKDVRGAVESRKVLVLLFYNNRSADDVAVRRELAKVDGYGRQVFVDAHWIKSVGRYQAITRGANVEQSPTIVVADRNLKAETLVGFVDHQTINQAVVDALRASGGSTVKDPYFRQIDALCVSAEKQVKALGQPSSAAAVPAFLAGVHAISVKADAQAAAIKPPKKHAKFSGAFNEHNAATSGLLAQALKDAKANPASSVSIVRSTVAKGQRLERKFVAQHGAHGLSCF
jgi:hypothetical protein